MSNQNPIFMPFEMVPFLIGMWLIPHAVGYWIVGVCFAMDVVRWGVLVAHWRERRQ